MVSFLVIISRASVSLTPGGLDKMQGAGGKAGGGMGEWGMGVEEEGDSR